MIAPVMPARSAVLWILIVSALLRIPTAAMAADFDPLAVGIAGHAFDHLGEIADQADAAAASGANIIYATGLGSFGYTGLPAAAPLAKSRDEFAAYLKNARGKGIRLAIGYVCATSIVKLDTFDKHWPDDFRARFKTPPSQWLQQDRDGKPLASWYAGDYLPACMNNPDWRNYEEQIVAMQLDAGCDGIFFDNPTVHPQGCYCDHCMKKFAPFIGNAAAKDASPADLRRLSASRPADFLRFRATIAADFLKDIRTRARKTHPTALITANNSLNSPETFFSQIRTYGYSIADMTRGRGAEDLIVIEDMATQPRMLPDGKTTIEYGPVYELLRAIGHDKPIVATVLAESDYHTPPNLMRLAMAEAAAHGASYLAWPTWPAEQRDRMAKAVRPQADFLRAHADLLNNTQPLVDAILFLPYDRWVQSPDCRALAIARDLAAHNIQFSAVSEEDLQKALAARVAPTLIIESDAVLNDAQRATIEKYRSSGGIVIAADKPDSLAAIQPIVTIENAPNIRVVARRQAGKTILHLLNLNVQRINSFEDRVTPATDVRIRIRFPRPFPKSIIALTADPDGSTGPIAPDVNGEGMTLSATLGRVVVSSILTLE
jgi:hypothetical protein